MIGKRTFQSCSLYNFSLAMAITLHVSGCGSKNSTAQNPNSSIDFECHKRSASTKTEGSIVAKEFGVALSCASGPSLLRWKVTAMGHAEKKVAITPEEFEELWSRVDASGWRQFGERCENTQTRQDAAATTIEISDYRASARVVCPGTTPPFPYGSVTEELTQAGLRSIPSL